MSPTFDFRASLRIWAVDAVIAGVVVRVPPLPAADWLPVLATGDLTALLTLAGVNFNRALIGGDLTVDELTDALGEMIDQVTGRTWWSALLLAASGAAHWDLVGADLARAGVRFDRIPIAAALDAIYGSLCRHLDEQGVKRFNADLERAPGVMQAAGRKVPERLLKRAESLPATAEQYVRERPKTQLRRPPPLPDDSNGKPTPRRRAPAGSGRRARSAPPPADGPGSGPAG